METTRPIGVGSCASLYPPAAVEYGWEGTTVVAVDISPQGTVASVSVKVPSGHAALDAASIRCARQWTFRAASQNGTPVEARKDFCITWATGKDFARVTDGERSFEMPHFPSAPHPIPAPEPAGWEVTTSFYAHLSGIVISYDLSHGVNNADQYLSAGLYSKFSDIDDFVAKSDATVQVAPNVRLLNEGPTTVCHGESASEIEYVRSGLVQGDPSRLMDVEQIRTVKDGYAYVATYVRPSDAPKRPEAEQWIRSFCEPPPSAANP